MPAKRERRNNAKSGGSPRSPACSKSPKKKPDKRRKSESESRTKPKKRVKEEKDEVVDDDDVKSKKPKITIKPSKSQRTPSPEILPPATTTSLAHSAVIPPQDRLNNLEDIYGLRGPRYLHKALTTCQDPQDMLQQFRTEEGILVPTLRPAVAMLDLMDIARLDFHQKCAEQLRQVLLDRVTSLSKETNSAEHQKRLQELLDKCFSGLNLPLVRPVVLHVLKNLSVVDERFKKEIMENKELYAACDIPLKRQIWMDRMDLFEAEVGEPIKSYIAHRRDSLFEISPSSSLFTIQGNIRRQDPSLSKMADIVGESSVLYDWTVKLIKKHYKEMADTHYATLRLDFLIHMHERHPNHPSLMSTDAQAYKFAFLMDAAVRARHVEPKRKQDITAMLDTLRKKDHPLLHEVAMILSDPQILYFNATSAMRLVQAVTTQDGLPRDNPMLLFFLRMLSIGVHAMEYVNDQLAKEGKYPASVVCEFLPNLCAIVVSNQAKAVNKDKVKEAVGSLDWLLPSLKKDPVSVWLVVQWIAYLLRQNDQDTVRDLIRMFPQCYGQMPLKIQDIVHNVVIQLAHTPQEQRWTSAFADCVFREYFRLDKAVNPTAARHALRLMYYVYAKLETGYRDEVLAWIAKNTDAAVQQMLQTVRNRIATSVPVSSAAVPKTPLSPTSFAFSPR